MSPEEVAPLRAEEQRRACNIVGVDDLEILDFPDGLLEPTHELRRAIARKIREFRPNAVVVTTFDLQVQWGLNHVDHRHAGVATVDAIRDADNPWVFTDLKDEDLKRGRQIGCSSMVPSPLTPWCSLLRTSTVVCDRLRHTRSIWTPSAIIRHRRI